MQLTEPEHAITKSVVTTFVTERQAAPRWSLLAVFEQPKTLDRLASLRILEAYDSSTIFLPTVLAFHYCNVPAFVQAAKSSIDAVVRALQALFRTGGWDNRRTYIPENLGIYTGGPNFVPFPNQISLGLFLVREFGVLQGYSTNAEHTEITQFQISEDVLTFKDIEKEWDEFVRQRTEPIRGPAQPARVEGITPLQSDSRKVFLVHGHDEAVKQSVARFLARLELEPIILHEQPNKSQTVIEKFEANSDVGFAVVLLTPDDEGRAVGKDLKPRARQNVILELGYFIGKLRRARVCALYKGDIELPSDIHGVTWVRYDEAGGWRLELAKELKAAEIAVDLNLA
jgi:predicted nucleotide-binding protein